MKLLLMLVQRYGSKSPKLFRMITTASIVMLVICQTLLVIESRVDIKWLTEDWSSLLNDAVFLFIGIALPSAATTDNKELQNKTDEILK